MLHERWGYGDWSQVFYSSNFSEWKHGHRKSFEHWIGSFNPLFVFLDNYDEIRSKFGHDESKQYELVVYHPIQSILQEGPQWVRRDYWIVNLFLDVVLWHWLWPWRFVRAMISQWIISWKKRRNFSIPSKVNYSMVNRIEFFFLCDDQSVHF